MKGTSLGNICSTKPLITTAFKKTASFLMKKEGDSGGVNPRKTPPEIAKKKREIREKGNADPGPQHAKGPLGSVWYQNNDPEKSREKKSSRIAAAEFGSEKEGSTMIQCPTRIVENDVRAEGNRHGKRP